MWKSSARKGVDAAWMESQFEALEDFLRALCAKPHFAESEEFLRWLELPLTDDEQQ